MRAVQVAQAHGEFELVERPIPEPAPNQVRVRVEACGICHSDLLAKEGFWPGITYPRIPGHEVAGRVDKAGSAVTNWKHGERVGVGWHAGHCFVCEPCRAADFINCERAHYIDAGSVDRGEVLRRMGGAHLVFCTAPSGKAIAPLIAGLKPRGRIFIVAAATDPIPLVSTTLLSGRSIAGWPSGTSKDSEDTLNFSVLTGARAMIETFPLERAAEAYEHMLANKARFRAVLTVSKPA